MAADGVPAAESAAFGSAAIAVDAVADDANSNEATIDTLATAVAGVAAVVDAAEDATTVCCLSPSQFRFAA